MNADSLVSEMPAAAVRPVMRAVHHNVPPSIRTAKVAAMATGRAFCVNWTVRAIR